MQGYELPTPQAVFEIGYFKQDPKPFFHLAKELYPGFFKVEFAGRVSLKVVPYKYEDVGTIW